MGQYRTSRNIEASFIDFLEVEVNKEWDDIQVINEFGDAYNIPLPTICVRLQDTDYDPVEIGSNKKTRSVFVLIDIFANNDGIRLDLKDFLVEILKDGCPYYKYTISKGEIEERKEDGRIRVTNIDDTQINFGDPKNDLDVHDRYRHLLTLTVSTGKVE